MELRTALAKAQVKQVTATSKKRGNKDHNVFALSSISYYISVHAKFVPVFYNPSRATYNVSL
jgi:hypothetical protein